MKDTESNLDMDVDYLDPESLSDILSNEEIREIGIDLDEKEAPSFSKQQRQTLLEKLTRKNALRTLHEMNTLGSLQVKTLPFTRNKMKKIASSLKNSEARRKGRKDMPRDCGSGFVSS